MAVIGNGLDECGIEDSHQFLGLFQVVETAV